MFSLHVGSLRQSSLLPSSELSCVFVSLLSNELLLVDAAFLLKEKMFAIIVNIRRILYLEYYNFLIKGFRYNRFCLKETIFNPNPLLVPKH